MVEKYFHHLASQKEDLAKRPYVHIKGSAELCVLSSHNPLLHWSLGDMFKSLCRRTESSYISKIYIDETTNAYRFSSIRSFTSKVFVIGQTKSCSSPTVNMIE